MIVHVEDGWLDIVDGQQRYMTFALIALALQEVLGNTAERAEHQRAALDRAATLLAEITGGKLCEVVYDGVGQATFPASLDCLKPFGTFASFGSASGAIDAFNNGKLAAHNVRVASIKALFTQCHNDTIEPRYITSIQRQN